MLLLLLLRYLLVSFLLFCRFSCLLYFFASLETSLHLANRFYLGVCIVLRQALHWIVYVKVSRLFVIFVGYSDSSVFLLIDLLPNNSKWS